MKMISFILSYIFAIAIVATTLALPLPLKASPSPSTGSSAVWNYIHSSSERNGFELAGPTKPWEIVGWEQQFAKLHETEHVMTFEAPKSAKTQASLSVRVDHLPEVQRAFTLQKYVETWLKEYPRFGFDVTETRYYNHTAGLAFQTDFNSNNRKMRQVVMMKDATAVIFTCSELPDAFAAAATTCDEIVKQFRWK